jgi:hypothetical protein
MYEEYFNPTEPNDYDVNPNESNKYHDEGANIVTRKDGFAKKRIRVFTSGGVGTCIRDAKTGYYYSNRIGSKDEDLFFKVIIATGECTSKNGYNKLFYSSPQQYENHLLCRVDLKSIAVWEEKRNTRLKDIKRQSF